MNDFTDTLFHLIKPPRRGTERNMIVSHCTLFSFLVIVFTITLIQKYFNLISPRERMNSFFHILHPINHVMNLKKHINHARPCVTFFIVDWRFRKSIFLKIRITNISETLLTRDEFISRLRISPFTPLSNNISAISSKNPGSMISRLTLSFHLFTFPSHIIYSDEDKWEELWIFFFLFISFLPISIGQTRVLQETSQRRMFCLVDYINTCRHFSFSLSIIFFLFENI